MRSFIQRRLGATRNTPRVHGTFRSEHRGVYAVQLGPRSYGWIDNVEMQACRGVLLRRESAPAHLT